MLQTINTQFPKFSWPNSSIISQSIFTKKLFLDQRFLPIFSNTSNTGYFLIYKMIQDLVKQEIPVIFVACKEHFSYYNAIFGKKMGINFTEKVQNGNIIFIDAFSNLYKNNDTGMLPISETTPPTFSLHIPPKIKRISLLTEDSKGNSKKIISVLENILDTGISKENIFLIFEDISQLFIQIGINSDLEKIEFINTLKLFSMYHTRKLSIILNINQDFESHKIYEFFKSQEDLHIEIFANLSGYSKDVTGMLKIITKNNEESQFFRYKTEEFDTNLIEFKMI